MKNETVAARFGPISLYGFRARTVAWFKGREMREMPGGWFSVNGVGEFASRLAAYRTRLRRRCGHQRNRIGSMTR